jgi:hypothetical protein
LAPAILLSLIFVFTMTLAPGATLRTWTGNAFENKWSEPNNWSPYGPKASRANSVTSLCAALISAVMATISLSPSSRYGQSSNRRKLAFLAFQPIPLLDGGDGLN